jgi:hypothetical protein
MKPRSSLSDNERRDCLSNDISLGKLRAFDALQRHHRADMERDLEKRWKEQDRLRVWRVNHSRALLGRRKPDRDRGVIEAIWTRRNDERRTMTPEEGKSWKGRIGEPPLPKDDRAIYARATHVFYWGP